MSYLRFHLKTIWPSSSAFLLWQKLLMINCNYLLPLNLLSPYVWNWQSHQIIRLYGDRKHFFHQHIQILWINLSCANLKSNFMNCRHEAEIAASSTCKLPILSNTPIAEACARIPNTIHGHPQFQGIETFFLDELPPLSTVSFMPVWFQIQSDRIYHHPGNQCIWFLKPLVSLAILCCSSDPVFFSTPPEIC